ncbi:ClpB protein [Klebsiella pneumoniae]|uniref:ClpB protein n=1 Tax=Klebsiella pneumoniae TaxID=573 RepID=A0A2X3CNL1_KLEPN|nr:ClpB protein [Klebsiella pneumoniae]
MIYRPLPAGALRAIVGMKLGQVSQRLACHYGITTTLSESLFDALTEACLLPDTGARNVDSLLKSADPAGTESAAIEPYGGGGRTAPGDAGVSRRGRRRDGV